MKDVESSNHDMVDNMKQVCDTMDVMTNASTSQTMFPAPC